MRERNILFFIYSIFNSCIFMWIYLILEHQICVLKTSILLSQIIVMLDELGDFLVQFRLRDGQILSMSLLILDAALFPGGSVLTLFLLRYRGMMKIPSWRDPPWLVYILWLSSPVPPWSQLVEWEEVEPITADLWWSHLCWVPWLVVWWWSRGT